MRLVLLNVLAAILLMFSVIGSNSAPYLYPDIHFADSYSEKDRYNIEMMINNVSYQYYQLLKDKSKMWDRPWTVDVADRAFNCSMPYKDATGNISHYSKSALGIETNGNHIDICLGHGNETSWMVTAEGHLFAHEMAHLLVMERTGDYRAANNLVHYAENYLQSTHNPAYFVTVSAHFEDLATPGDEHIDLINIDKLIAEQSHIMTDCYWIDGINPYY